MRRTRAKCKVYTLDASDIDRRGGGSLVDRHGGCQRALPAPSVLVVLLYVVGYRARWYEAIFNRVVRLPAAHSIAL